MVSPKKQYFLPKINIPLYIENTGSTSQKLGMILENKVVPKLKLEKKKKCTINGLIN
jgi:hypothetical protein